MTIVKGVINAKSNKYDKFSIVVDTGSGEAWYSSKFEINAQPGDLVEFESGPDGKKWCSKLKVLSSGNETKGKDGSTRTQTSSGGNGGGGGSKPANRPFLAPAMDSQRSIIRQNALTQANSLVASQGLTGVSAADLIVIAKELERYSAGDEENERVKKHKAEQAMKAAEAEATARKEAEARAQTETMDAGVEDEPPGSGDDPFDGLFDEE